MQYDAIRYANQVKAYSDKHKKANDLKIGSAEHFSGMTKEDKLVPVITVVMYLGDVPWDGPRTLHDMLNVTEPAILRMIPNYKINLIEPHEMSATDLEQFHTDMRYILETLGATNSKKKMRKLLDDNPEPLRHMAADAALLVGNIANLKSLAEWEKSGKEEIDMCQAINELLIDERIEGRTEGGNYMLYNLAQNGKLSIKDAAEEARMTKSEFIKNASLCGFTIKESE